MEFFEAVSKRHSYRGDMKNEAVLREDLEKIVQAGLQAPSGCNAQTTRFVIVDDDALIARIHEMHPKNKAMQQAKAYIACIVDVNPEAVYEGYSFQVEDCATAVENMLLAITALRHASVWIDGWLRLESRAEKIGEMLGVPEGKMIRVLLPIGVPAEQWQPNEKMTFSKRAWFNRYEG